jgi:hypothetical protein
MTLNFTRDFARYSFGYGLLKGRCLNSANSIREVAAEIEKAVGSIRYTDVVGDRYEAVRELRTIAEVLDLWANAKPGRRPRSGRLRRALSQNRSLARAS